MISAAVKTQKGESFNQPASELTHLPGFATTSVPLLQLPAVTQPVIVSSNRRKVLFVTSELADLVKTGGWVMFLPRCRAPCATCTTSEC